MELKFTGHLLDRMAQRSITREDIETAVANQLTTWRNPSPSSTTIVGAVGERRLMVYIVEELPTDFATIKSAVWKEE